MIKAKTGWKYIPCHTFILERLFVLVRQYVIEN